MAMGLWGATVLTCACVGGCQRGACGGGLTPPPSARHPPGCACTSCVGHGAVQVPHSAASTRDSVPSTRHSVPSTKDNAVR
eukprot:1062607-Rhodomonas_salina.1